MVAYYNEIDLYAAQWLRNLIAAGHIAPGDVDERSIEDVTPSELKGYTQCHFFAGIGVWSLALRNAGWPDDRPVWTGSCPCQPFSAAGKGAGFADERHLWPSWFWLIEQCAPHNIFGEQVAGKPGETWLDLVSTDLESGGYTVGAAVTAACGFGAPHQRKRLYWSAHDERGKRQHQPIGRRSGSMGNACSARSGRHAGAVPGEKKSGDSEGIQAGCVADQPQPTSAAGNLADAERHRPQGSIDEVSWERAVSDTRRSADESDAGPLAHTPSERRHGATDTPGTARRGGSEGGSVARRALDDTASARRQRTQPNAEGQARDEARLRLSSLGRGESYWGDADWIPCTDGKARPVEPGTFPLAHGVANRVGRLCAYGNAIVAPQAQAFISAYLERRPVKRAVTIQI